MVTIANPFENPISRERLHQLRDVVNPGPVLILTHDNPDPDALASGLGFSRLLKAWSIGSQLVYSGLVTRAENKAMLEVLTPEWEYRDELPDLGAFQAIALVDTQPNAGNNDLPSNVIPHVVIDHHHPVRDKMDKVPFVELRPEVGATVSLVYQYLDAANVLIDTQLATAIFYGLKTDTRGLSRGDSTTDQAVYFRLLSMIDRSLLAQVEHAGLPREYFRRICDGLKAAAVHGDLVITDLGELHRPDFVAEMADLLVRLENTRAVLCLGYHDNLIYISLRTESTQQDAGMLIQRIVQPPGKAGGHGTVAGGQMPLGDADLDEQEAGRLCAEIKQRFLDVMGGSRVGVQLMV